MRARVLLVCACIIATLAMAAPSAHGAGRGARVYGTASGTGGFRFGACPLIQQVEDGTLEATVLGKARYHTEICVEVSPQITLSGTFLVTVRSGATLTGTINGTFTGGALSLPIQITGGTGRFARASGTLTFGPINQFDFTNCDPRVGRICLDWHDTAPISGRLTRGR